MMRIAHTESSINMGGQELRVLQQMEWLIGHGHASWLLAREDSAIYREAVKRSLPVHAVPFRGSVNPGALWRLMRFCWQERPDVIDCHSSRDASTAMIARRLGVPVVRTQHICKRIKDDFFHRLVWWWGSDRFIAGSQSIARRIVAQGLGASELIDIVAPGIDLARFRPDIDGSATRRSFGIPEGAKVVSVIGMIRPDKAQRYLIRAVDGIVARIPEAYFFVVGSATKPAFQAQLESEIQKIAHPERVVLTGYQPQVERFVAASDLIVLTSTIEARSQVIPQAFAMKKPVVATNVGGIPELVTDGKTGFLYPVGEVDRLTELAVHALSSDTTAQVEAAYQVALTELSFEQMMAATLAAYARAMGRA